jgi:hypothetical protein
VTGTGPASPSPEADGRRPGPIRRVLRALRHPFGGGSTLETPAKPVITSFEEAERAAYRASTMVPPAGEPAGSAPTIEPAADRSPVGTIAAASHEAGRPQAATDPDPAVRPAAQANASQSVAIRATVARDESVGGDTSSSVEPFPSSAAPDAPGTRTRRQPGETAPERLLRAPAAAASVADDFFDGLVRRVEGDR